MVASERRAGLSRDPGAAPPPPTPAAGGVRPGGARVARDASGGSRRQRDQRQPGEVTES